MQHDVNVVKGNPVRRTDANPGPQQNPPAKAVPTNYPASGEATTLAPVDSHAGRSLPPMA